MLIIALALVVVVAVVVIDFVVHAVIIALVVIIIFVLLASETGPRKLELLAVTPLNVRKVNRFCCGVSLPR